MTTHATEDQPLLDAALRTARDTRLLVLEREARHQVGGAFASLFGGDAAIVIADENTFAAAGRDALDSLRAAGVSCDEPLVLPAAGLYAEYSIVEQVRNRLEQTAATPVAVGAGTINDLVKLAAHQTNRPYLAVATAASMDGYTAYGASIALEGSKQTFDCPAPRGVVADLDVIAAAPREMNAAGYADLAAKCPAGADWLLADALGEEPIDPRAWDAVQSRLRFWLAEPAGIRRGDFEALRHVTVALMMTGFAMQTASSSRPASGAEHQFSHLWDMEHHTHGGQTPSHGFKVGIGSLASLALYEALFEFDIEGLAVDRAVRQWPDAAANDEEIAALFEHPELAAKAKTESAAKLIRPAALRTQLEKLKRDWPTIRRRLDEQLLTRAELEDRLQEAGCPTASEEIGIPRDRLRHSYRQAYHIRRRFTLLDLARRTALFEPALQQIFRAP